MTEARPAGPVTTSPGRVRRTTRTRWAIAGLLAAAVVVASVAVTVLLTSKAGPPSAYAFVPTDIQAVAEVRPELPGDQHANLGGFLSHFPGFADQSILDTKIDEALDQILDRVANRPIDYIGQLKPYLAGPTIVSIRNVAALQSTSTVLPEGTTLILTTRDDVACSRVGTVTATEQRAGHDVALLSGTAAGACSRDGDHLILGSSGDVGAVLDARAARITLDTDATFMAASAAVAGDRVGMLFVTRAGFLAAGANPAAPGASPAASLSPEMLPDWAAMTVRAETTGLVADLVMPPTAAALSAASHSPTAASTGSGSPVATVGPPRPSTVAKHLPADTLGAFEVRDTGPMLVDGFAAIRAAGGDVAASLTQVESALNLLGGTKSFTDWMGDSAVALIRDGSSITGGLVIQASSEAQAADKLGQIKTILGFAGGQLGVAIADAPYAAGSITTLSFDKALVAGQLSSEQAAALPDRIEIAFTIQNGIVVVSPAASFVKAIVDTNDDASLAAQARYQRALALAGSSGLVDAYVDVPAALQPGVTLLDPQTRALYEREYAPYAAPLDAVALTAVPDGGFVHLRLALAVRDTRNGAQ